MEIYTQARRVLHRYARLGIIAVGSFSLNLGLTIGLTEGLQLAPQVSFAVVLALVFAGNFLATRYWVFRDRINESNGWAHFIKCILVSAAFRGLEWLAFYWLLGVIDIHYTLALVGVLVVSFLAKSLVYDTLVFR